MQTETVIGIDLCSDYTVLHRYGTEQVTTIPTVICRDREEEVFSIGEEAYRRTLRGGGVLVDKLLRLARRGGTATIGGTCYEAGQLLQIFLKKALCAVLKTEEPSFRTVSSLIITLSKNSEDSIGAVRDAARAIGFSEDRLRIISHTEAMMYYILSGEKEFFSSAVALFDLSEEKLFYYEMKVIRGMQRMSVVGEGRPMDESFNLDILKNEAGRKLGDNILLACAEKLMAKKNYSAVFLTGKGFEQIDSFPQFREFICRRRRVLAEQGLFARGASAAAMDRRREQTAFPYVFICESRLQVDVSMNIRRRNREERLLLASAGEFWEETRGRIEVIPWQQDYVDIDIQPVDRLRGKKTVRIPLKGFPERPDRCTRVSIDLSFPSAGRMRLCLSDEGLGEIFPRSDACVIEEIELT